MNSNIVLMRHGITTGNVQQMYYGSTDVPLADRGIRELRELAQAGIYPRGKDARYYTSGMLRAEQTLALIYGDREHEAIEELRELDFGDFEMKSYDQLENIPEYRAWIAAEDDSFPPPGGESIKDFNVRVAIGFDRLRERHEALACEMRKKDGDALSICICHGGVICSILYALWPDRYESFYEWIPAPGHGYILTVEGGEITGAEKF